MNIRRPGRALAQGRFGIGSLKVAVGWALEAPIMLAFAQGTLNILFVAEKRQVMECELKKALRTGKTTHTLHHTNVGFGHQRVRTARPKAIDVEDCTNARHRRFTLVRPHGNSKRDMEQMQCGLRTKWDQSLGASTASVR